MFCSVSRENVVSGATQPAGERGGTEGSSAAILDSAKQSALLEGKKSSSSIIADLARKSAILEKGRGSVVLEGSSVVMEGGAMEAPSAAEGEGEGEEGAAATNDLKAASEEEVGGGDGSAHQQESRKEEETLGGKVKQRRKKYVLKGGASALAVQLFGIDDKFEMRLVFIIHALVPLITHKTIVGQLICCRWFFSYFR